MAEWQDRYWNSSDGLRLHYRDYAGPRDRPPILCLPGLTRNARDFEPVADRLAGEWRVIAVEFRGRGAIAARSRSRPITCRHTYAADVLKLLDQLGIADAVFFGTSLGGIVTMLLSTTDPERIAGAVLNDIGPVVEDAGVERLRTYVGKGGDLGELGRGGRSRRPPGTASPFPITRPSNGSASPAGCRASGRTAASRPIMTWRSPMPFARRQGHAGATIPGPDPRPGRHAGADRPRRNQRPVLGRDRGANARAAAEGGAGHRPRHRPCARPRRARSRRPASTGCWSGC